MRNFPILLAALAFIVAAPSEASMLTYDFTVTATSGPLSGTTANGSFSYDSASITPAANNNATGLLTALNFTWDGITFDATSANTGSLFVDPAGNLLGFLIGTNCTPGVCFVGGLDTWSANTFFTGGQFLYLTGTGGFGFGKVTSSPAPTAPTPEPATPALLFGGLAGIGALRRMRRSA